MTRKLVSLLLTVALLLTAAAFAEGESITVTDMFGRSVTLNGPAERIVALSAADCEILCALGCEEKIVGRGAYCNYPESILDLPVVESGAETNIEQIIALAPQAVVMADMAQTKDHVAQLENNGIAVVVLNADSIEGTYEAIRILGAMTAKDAEAEAMIADMQATFDDIASKAQDGGKSVYFEISPLQWGLWTAGSATFMDELAAICGVKNAFGDVAGWAEVSEEQVLLRNPDYIVTTSGYYGEGPLPDEEILGRAGWNSITAVADGMVYAADNDMITRPGPRLKDAALNLYEFFYGNEK